MVVNILNVFYQCASGFIDENDFENAEQIIDMGLMKIPIDCSNSPGMHGHLALLLAQINKLEKAKKVAAEFLNALENITMDRFDIETYTEMANMYMADGLVNEGQQLMGIVEKQKMILQE